MSIAMALVLGTGAFAQEAQMSELPAEPSQTSESTPAKGGKGKKSGFVEHLQNHFKFYGFIRNYFAFDTREVVAGSGDLYFWFPVDESFNAQGEDIYANPQFRFLSLTTRVGVDVYGYKAGNYEFGGKIEADFYAGLTGSTGTAQLRLRQAYATVARDWRYWKIGQAWHPMAADLPDVFSLESGAPFGPFSRTPLVAFTATLPKGFSITAAAIWQMQYASTGPLGVSANYIKYSCTPECYLGVNWQNDRVLLRLGGDVLSIKPYTRRSDVPEISPIYNAKVADRITTCNVFQYGQYRLGDFTLKEKLTYGNDGSHFNLVGGYGATGEAADGVSRNYAATNVFAGWTTLQWKRKDCRWVPQMFVGYLYNFGTAEPVISTECWAKNGAMSIAQMFRIQPEILYNIGKFQIGLEYMLTQVQYGDMNRVWMHATENLHWVANHRVQAMVKFNF